MVETGYAMEHVSVEELRDLVLRQNGKTNPRVVAHLVSGCEQCGQLIKRELIDSGRLKPNSSLWHPSEEEIRILVTDLASTPVEVFSHFRDGCGYCRERARRIYREFYATSTSPGLSLVDERTDWE